MALGGASCSPSTVPRFPIAVCALAATLTSAVGAFPGPAPKHAPIARAGSPGPSATRFGRSLGSPTEGHLVGGERIEEAPYLRIVPTYAGGDVRWGLEPLVTMIDRAARSVRRQFPDAVASVGHLSREGGGDLASHRSHESGRDADVGFYVRSASGKPLLPSRFVAFRGDGSAVGWPGAQFDDAKNWALVAAMIGDSQAHVTHLFVAAPLRARLLQYAERTGAPAQLRMRAAEVMQQPHGSLPHDDHFHVRIGCPPHMGGCVENPMAARAHHAPHGAVPFARGRRGSAARTIVTPAPTRAPVEPAPAPPAAPVDPEPSPDAPPAVMSAPIDDVDG